jgi:probable phosphoglycerate mutase
MVALGKTAHLNPPPHVEKFIQNVLDGINQSISKAGPVLIVAHGGIHWALCCVLGIEDHEWGIDNCVPVHFTINEEGRWKADKLK